MAKTKVKIKNRDPSFGRPFCLDGKGRQDGGLCNNAAEDIMLIHYSKRILRLCRQRDNGRNWSIKIAYKGTSRMMASSKSSSHPARKGSFQGDDSVKVHIITHHIGT